MPATAAAMRKRVVSVGASQIQIPRGLGQITRDSFFIYAQNFTFVGNDNQQAAIAIQADAHFICVMTMYDTNIAAVGGFGAGVNAQFGGALVLITDGSQRNLSNIAVPVSTLFGTAQRPYVWPFTHLFRANAPITLSVTGIVAATAQTIRLCFGGFKVPIGSLPELGL